MSRFELLEVIDAKHTSVGNVDMTVRARIDGEEMTIPFGYNPADPYGLAPAIKEWWEQNPNFPIAPAD